MEDEQLEQKLDIHIMEGTEIIPNINKKSKLTHPHNWQKQRTIEKKWEQLNTFKNYAFC